MRANARKLSVYVVYPAALFDGWEVVQEHDDDPVWFESREAAIAYASAHAATAAGGGIVKVENWFGDTESIREVRSDDTNQLAVSLS